MKKNSSTPAESKDSNPKRKNSLFPANLKVDRYQMKLSGDDMQQTGMSLLSRKDVKLAQGRDYRQTRRFNNVLELIKSGKPVPERMMKWL